MEKNREIRKECRLQFVTQMCASWFWLMHNVPVRCEQSEKQSEEQVGTVLCLQLFCSPKNSSKIIACFKNKRAKHDNTLL